jgi:uncharacterized cofD-like protein
MQKIKVVTIGGGTVGFIIDRGLAQLENIELTSITSPFDDGGSTGRLRDELGVLPQGDVRRRLIAHDIRKESLLRDLFLHRFENGKDLKDHSLGNIILSGAEQLWGKEKYLDKAAEIFGITGTVLPMSLDNAKLLTELSDGSVVEGETDLDFRDLEDERAVSKIYLKGRAKINPRAEKAILNADFIIICPGDLYTSLLPNFLVEGTDQALQKSKAQIIFMTNIMTKFSETRNFDVEKFLSEFEKYAKRQPDVVIHNNKKISQNILDKYKKEEKVELVNVSSSKNIKPKLISVDLLNQKALSQKLIRHDSLKSAKVLQKVFKSRLFIWDLDYTIFDVAKTFYKQDMTYNKQVLKRKEFGLKDMKYQKLYYDQDLLKLIKNDKQNVHVLLTASLYRPDFQMEKIKAMGLEKYFTEIFVMDKKGSKKKYIQKILSKYRFSKSRTLVLGDSLEEEIQAAADLGIDFVRFRVVSKFNDVPSKLKPLLEINKKEDILKIFDPKTYEK